MNFQEYIKQINNPVIVKDKDNLLKFILGKRKERSGFEEHLAIGCWSENIISEKFQVVNTARAITRIDGILKDNILIDKTDLLVLICAYPVINKTNVHHLELVMPLVRKHGYVVVSEEYLVHEKTRVHIMKLAIEEKNKRINLLLQKSTVWDFISKYTVDKEAGKIMAEAVFRIVGITMTQETRKIAHQLCKKFPKLQYGEGKAPEIKVVSIPRSRDFKFDNAVAVNLVNKGVSYRIGWLSANEEEILEDFRGTPNEIVTDFLQADKGAPEDMKIIQGARLSSFGTFSKEGKVLYFGKITLELNLNNIKE